MGDNELKRPTPIPHDRLMTGMKVWATGAFGSDVRHFEVYRTKVQIRLSEVDSKYPYKSILGADEKVFLTKKEWLIDKLFQWKENHKKRTEEYERAIEAITAKINELGETVAN